MAGGEGRSDSAAADAAFNALGTAGGVLFAIALLPQLWRVVWLRHITEISYGWLVLFITGLTAFLAYSFWFELWPVFGPACFEISSYATFLLLKILYDRGVIWRKRDAMTNSMTNSNASAGDGRALQGIVVESRNGDGVDSGSSGNHLLLDDSSWDKPVRVTLTVVDCEHHHR